MKKYNLPPKIFIVHRFTRFMVTNAKQIMLHPEVQIVMNMDGWGAPWLKRDSYQAYIVKEPVDIPASSSSTTTIQRRATRFSRRRRCSGSTPRQSTSSTSNEPLQGQAAARPSAGGLSKAFMSYSVATPSKSASLASASALDERTIPSLW